MDVQEPILRIAYAINSINPCNWHTDTRSLMDGTSKENSVPSERPISSLHQFNALWPMIESIQIS